MPPCPCDNAAALAAYLGGKAQLLAGGISVAAAAVQAHPGLEADEAKASGELLAMGRKWFSRNGLNQK